MTKSLFVVTGTTSGIGQHLENILREKKCNVEVINRENVDFSNAEASKNYAAKFTKYIEENYQDHLIVFVINAASIGSISPLSHQNLTDIEDIVNINFLTPLFFLNCLSKINNRWSVLNITSGASKTYNKYLGLYSTTKLALENYLKFIEIEKPSNFVQSRNYNPGVVNTKMNHLLKKNKFFNSKKLEKIVAKDAIMVAEEIFLVLKNMVNDDKNTD